MIDILPDNSYLTVTDFLKELIHRETCEIQYVTMGPWPSCRDAVKKVLPQATTIVDKCHLTSLAETVIDNCIIHLAKKLPVEQRRALINEISLFKRPVEEPDITHRLSYEAWLGSLSDLNTIIQLKHSFEAIWESSTKEAALKRYENWSASIPATLEELHSPASSGVAGMEGRPM